MALKDVLAEVIGERNQAEVARAVDRDRSQLSRWLSGEWRPSADVLSRLLEVCGASPAQTVAAWEAFGAPADVLATPEEIAARRRRLADSIPVGP